VDRCPQAPRENLPARTVPSRNFSHAAWTLALRTSGGTCTGDIFVSGQTSEKKLGSMEHLEHPTAEQWEVRRRWFESHIFHYEELGSYLVGEQASALISEVESCFCAGAWAAVVILSFAVVEGNLQETSSSKKRRRSVELLEHQGFGAGYDRLRKRRNSLVHATPESPALTIDQQWDDRASLEAEAREAVVLMFQAFYSQAGT